jgi:putative transcriptional regulator
MRNRIQEFRSEKRWSQAEFAQRVGVSRQTINALETGRSEPSLPMAFRIGWVLKKPVQEIFLVDLEEKMQALGAAWEYKDRAATAFNEVGLLERMGRFGWEMIGFGPGVLRFRRPEDDELRVRWDYQRVNGALPASLRTQLESEDWLYCGSWMGLFHYFKRATGERAQLFVGE